MAKKAFSIALKEATSLPGENFLNFKGQFAQLSDKDKLELSAYMTASGIEHEPPTIVAAKAV